jgi:hypothetical protein
METVSVTATYIRNYGTRFEVLTAVLQRIQIFWDVT